LWNADEPLAPAPATRWRAWIWSGSALLIVFLVAAATMTLLSEHRTTTRTTAAAAQQSAQLLRVVVDQMIRDVDGLADGLQMVLVATTPISPSSVVSDATWAWLDQRLLERPAVQSHALLDRQGIVRRASLDHLVGRSFAERPSFRMHRQSPATGTQLFAGDRRASQPGSDRELQATWPLHDAVGVLAGVLMVGFDVDMVEQRLGRLIDPSHDIVALVDGDGAILAAAGVGGGRALDLADWDDGLTSLLRAARSGGGDSGAVQHVRLLGTDALWAAEVQNLATIDGSIVLARNVDRALAGWRRQAVAVALGTGLLLAAILASAAALTGLLERQGRALAAATIDALVDPLTRLFNRRMFEAVAGIELARARRQASDLALVLLDIDHFKAVNDRHGHAAGDAVLVAVAMQLRALIRQEDLLARIGGEEFVLLLPRLPLPRALRRAERLRRSIETLDVDVGSGVLNVTISLGVTVVGKDERAIEAALAAADTALYSAKAGGRNQVAVAEGPAAAQQLSA
jgi:diguanylate cyclase (GGDEF)-like protein